MFECVFRVLAYVYQRNEKALSTAKVNTKFLVSNDVRFMQFFRQNLMELVEKNRKS